MRTDDAFWVVRCSRDFDFLPTYQGGLRARGFRLGEFVKARLSSEGEHDRGSWRAYVEKSVHRASHFVSKDVALATLAKCLPAWTAFFEVVYVTVTVQWSAK